jgi:hypothetical protein
VGLAARLIQYLQRWIYADHLDTEMRDDQFGKARCAAAKFDDRRHLGSIDMNRE